MSLVYVVELDHLIDAATIHLVGGCRFQTESETPLHSRDIDWSYLISSLREARNFALMARKKHTDLCEFCEQNGRFGA